MTPLETIDGDILWKCEDYHILGMKTNCLIQDNKHKIITTVDYVKNQKHYRKVFENILELKEEGNKDEQ